MTYVKCRSQSSEMLATFNMAGDQWRNICGAVELVGRQGRVVCDITFTMFAYKLPASASNLTPITTTTDPQSLNQCSRIFSAQKPSIASVGACARLCGELDGGYWLDHSGDVAAALSALNACLDPTQQLTAAAALRLTQKDLSRRINSAGWQAQFQAVSAVGRKN